MRPSMIPVPEAEEVKRRTVPDRTGDPQVPVVRFFVNGVNLLKLGTFRFQSFTHQRATNSAAGSKFTLTVFDENWTDVEYILFAAGGTRDVFYDYGYVEGMNGPAERSPTYYGKFDRVSPAFSNGGVTLTIEGTGLSLARHLVQRNENFANMPIHEIVEKLATTLGFEIGYIEPTKPVKPLRDPNVTHRTFQMHNMSFFQFVTKVLTPLAVSKSGEGGYRLYFDNTAQVPKVYYAPADFTSQDRSILRDYVVNRHRMGEVLDFTPEIELTTLYGVRGGIVQSSFIDGASKEPTTITYSPEEKGTQTPSRNQSMTAYPEAGTSRMFVIPSQDPEDVLLHQEAVCKAARNGYLKATLRVIGDPLLIPLHYVKVAMFTQSIFQAPIGGISASELRRSLVAHYTSGVYQIMSVDDSIQGSVFESTMTLETPSARLGLDMSTKVG